MSRKQRIDLLLVEKGLFINLVEAQANILAGQVLVNNQLIDKAGSLVPPKASIRLRRISSRFVSRGGEKLAHALETFKIVARNKSALDIGVSTGGFSDCLLQAGVCWVAAVDVGYGQLAWKLRNHPKLMIIERTNFRFIKFSRLGTFFDLITIDTSFISLHSILQKASRFLTVGGDIVALVKPQFEAPQKSVEKGGIISDEHVVQQILEQIQCQANQLGLQWNAFTPSPILGKKKKNREYFIHLKKRAIPIV